jgi:hypothetical protein
MDVPATTDRIRMEEMVATLVAHWNQFAIE